MSEIHSITDVQIFDIYSYVVSVVYVEYTGGGECYEFRIFKDNQEIHFSEVGAGNAAAAASQGFRWISENGEF